MKFSALLSALLFASALSAGQHHTPAERFDLFEKYMVRRANEVTEHSLGNVKSLDDWKRTRPVVLKRMRYALGLDPMPPRTPLNAHITGTLNRAGYRVEKIVFESMPGLFVTGNLYLPEKIEGRVPAVLYVCGHAPGPAGAKAWYQHHGIWLSRHGYAAFLIDTVEFGEAPGIHHGTHDLGMWYWQSLGYTPAGPEVWNAMRAVDYLETRPEVDAKRVAITGISGGGAVTWYAAALDERFQAAASTCGAWTAEKQITQNSVLENCDCIYFPNTFLYDYPAVGALIAPRPFRIIGALRDVCFPPAGYHQAYERTRSIYDLYGAADHVSMFEWEAPHKDIVQFRKAADEWINHWLRHDDTPFNEGDIQREAEENLAVLDRVPVTALNARIHKLFIKTPKLQTWKTLPEWKARRAEVLAELKDKVFRGFPDTREPFDTWKSVEGGWTSKYADSFNVEFTTERDIRVKAQLFIPRDGKPSHPALIYAKGADDAIYPVDYDPLLPVFQTHVVLVIEPRMVGYPPIDNFKLTTIRMSAPLIGATVESMQLWDILRSVDYLTEGEGLKLDGISVYGRKQMGALALYAAALDERITRVVLDDPPASHWQAPALLNVLRITDLPEAAGLAAPREIVWLTAMPGAYSYTSSIYKLYGKKSGIREAGDLGEALR